MGLQLRFTNAAGRISEGMATAGVPHRAAAGGSSYTSAHDNLDVELAPDGLE